MSILRNWAGIGILTLVGFGAEVMPIQDWLYSGIIWFIAFIWLVYWFFSRKKQDDLEIEIIPNKYLEGVLENGKYVENPKYALTPGDQFSAIFGLNVINHTHHKIYIDSASIVLRKRWCFGDCGRLFVRYLEIQDYPNHWPLKSIDIQPESKGEWSVNQIESIPAIHPFPKRSKLILDIKLVGETRRVVRTLHDFNHNPKLVPDIPDWKTE
ncbi:MAG: hypothetical protein HOC20_04560 [Chloroflexi bacterium]|jgi:hypothetical protein|nr:hypothetical protein [Chloroflexota bacterium]